MVTKMPPWLPRIQEKNGVLAQVDWEPGEKKTQGESLDLLDQL